MSEQIKQSVPSVSFWQSLSLYSPLITMISILVFSIFSSALNKGMFYLFSVFSITAARILILPKGDAAGENICNIGAVPNAGSTYSTFFLTFTLCYFVVPMFILSSMNSTNMINYGVVLFFTAYIGFDIIMKKTMGCLTIDMGLAGDFLIGGLAGTLIAGLLFYADKISLLFINELNSNKEVCSVPSKQQFRCNVLKNGMIIGSSVSA
jgi:hypothetical protein